VRRKNLLHLFQSEVDLFVAIVKMRREPYARCGAIIYEYVMREQLSRYFPRVGTVNRNSSPSFIRIEGSIHSPAAITSPLHDALALIFRFRPNVVDTGKRDDIQARLAGIKSGNARCAVQEPKRIVTCIDRTYLKLERPPMCQPVSEGFSLVRKSWRILKIRNSRSTTQPLQQPAHRKIGFEFAHIKRNSSSCLERVENNQCAHFVGTLDDRAYVYD
jgi:hypothetical protein